MKEKILSALTEKYKKLPFGKKAFDGVANYLVATVTDEADIETAIAGVESLLKSFQGDIDSRVRQFRDDAEKWRKKEADEEDADLDSNTPPPNPPKPPKPGKEESANPSDQLAAMMKTFTDTIGAQIGTLTTEISQIKSGKVTETRLQEVEAILKDAPKSFKTSKLRDFGNLKPIDKDEDWETYKADLAEDVKQISEEVQVKPSYPGAPIVSSAGGSKAPSQAETDKIVESLINF